MKKIVLLLSIISLFGCSNNPKIEEVSLKLEFNKFQLQEIKEKIVKASYKDIPLDYMHEEKNSELKGQYEKADVNFANYYIQVSTSCGTGCILRYIIDTRTGDAYEFPRLDHWEGNGNIGVLFSKNNSIVVVQADGAWSKDMQTNSTGIWNWNEQTKKFESVRLDEIIGILN
jgi:hypothetical protein